MSRGPFGRVDTASRLGESLEDFLNETVVGVMDEERPKWSDFGGVVDSDKLEEMKIKTDEKEERIRRQDEDWETALLGEWVVLEGIKSGWFGVADVAVQPASKHDDYFRGIDVICEFEVGERVIRLAIDVTTADPENGSNPMKAAATIYKKINGVLKRAKEGKHPGALELFKSNVGSKKAVGREEMLKAVVAISPKEVMHLAELSRRAREEDDQEAMEELRNSPFRDSFLGQIWGAVSFSGDRAQNIVRDQRRGANAINLASQIIAEVEKLEPIIADAGDGGEFKIDNKLVDMIYSGTVPDEFIEAIEKQRLDDVV